MTRLDEALAAAQQGAGSEGDFYNAFLNSEILIALSEAPDPARPESLKPILIEVDGMKYLMLFDTEERLAAWAKRKIDFAGVPGQALFGMMDLSIPWMLNAGTEYAKQFVAEELQWLKSSILKDG